MKLSVYSYTNQGGRAHNEDSLRWNCDGARGVFALADAAYAKSQFFADFAQMVRNRIA